MSVSQKSRSSLGRCLRGKTFAAVVIWPACCYSCEPEAVDVTPVVDSLIVLPPNVSVASTDLFELRVQVKDDRGYVLPPDYAIGTRWSATPELSVSGADDRAYVKSTGTVDVTGTVTASLGEDEGTKTGKATVKLVDAMRPVNAWLAATSSVNEPPMIALADGQAGSVTASDSLFAFVRSTQLLPFDGGSSSIVVYARDRQVTDAVLPVTGPCNHLNLKPTATPPPTAAGCGAPTHHPHGDPWPVNVRVFAAPGRAEQVDRDIAYAHRVFADAWSGIKLVTTREPALLDGTHVGIALTESGSCRSDGLEGDVRPQLVSTAIPSDSDPNPAFLPDLITVAYVDRITITSSELTPSGLQCPYDGTRGVIILIDATAHAPSTLAHELGHALGLGHSDPSEIIVVPAFEPSNLMWGAESDDIPVIRSGLTLGQTYRMSRTYGTFLERVAPMTPCQPEAALDTPCPRIRRDIRQR